MLRLLVIADTHYNSAAPADYSARRLCVLGRELLIRAIQHAQAFGGFDAVALLGDLLDDGNAPTAAGDLAELAADVKKLIGQTPLLVVPGNHDGQPQRLLTAFAQTSLEREIGGYRFISFADQYAADDVCTRSQADLQRLAALASQGGGPIVALQHNPLYPPIQSDYPFMHANNAQLLAQYSQCGALLSVSGHYHAGQALCEHGGVHYFTAPAAAESPFGYALLTLDGRRVGVQQRQLRLDERPAVVDCHAHTEFAYCGVGISARTVIERSRLMGLAGVCLVEHAPQLYCTADDFWAARHIRSPELWRGQRHSRMGQFRQAMQPLRSQGVRIGLEVELDADGRLTLHEQDRDWPDLLAGAVHWIPREPKELSDAELRREFMKASEGLLNAGVDVLAHPLRLFGWAKRAVPKDIYAPLADALARTNTAAEINFHKNQNDPEFFAQCICRGVRIALGSDTHEPAEAGALGPHLAILRQAADGRELADVLYDPFKHG